MPNCNEDVNFSKKLICFNALNQDIRKRIVKIILHVVIVRRITTQLFAIKRKIEIVITMEFSEIQVSYHKEIIKLVKLTSKLKFSMKMESVWKIYMKVT